MRRISSASVPNSVALVVVSAIALGAGIGQSRAEDCLAAPNAASPPGEHWYYRIDRVKQRKCWYLHAPLRVTHQARRASAPADAAIDHPLAAAPVPFANAPMPVAVAPMPAAAAPVPAPDPPIAESVAVTDNAPSQPQVAVLAVKTIAVRPPDGRAETRSRHGAGGALISETSARAYSAVPVRKSESPIFFVLVFGLGLATFLMAIVIKCVAPRASWLLRSARYGEDMAWPQERPDYSGDGPTRLKSRTRLAQERLSGHRNPANSPHFTFG